MVKELKAKHTLKDWFLINPLKFSLTSVAFITGILLFFFALNKLFLGTTAAMIRMPIFITVVIAMIYTILKLIKKLPAEPMDRHSFVAIDNGLTILYYFTVVFSTVLLAKNYATVLYLSALLSSYSVALFVISILFGIAVYLYTIGLVIESFYAAYKRAVFMGISKWKAFLSLPFGVTLLWLPGYTLPENTKTKKSIEIKPKWFSELTDWIISKPIYSISVFLLTIIFSYLFMDVKSAVLTLGFGLIFIAWILITGKNKFIKSIGGLYSTVAVALNIIFMALFLWFTIWPAVKISANIEPARGIRTVQTMPTPQPAAMTQGIKK